jgi:hypothetical protein
VRGVPYLSIWRVRPPEFRCVADSAGVRSRTPDLRIFHFFVVPGDASELEQSVCFAAVKSRPPAESEPPQQADARPPPLNRGLRMDIAMSGGNFN